MKWCNKCNEKFEDELFVCPNCKKDLLESEMDMGIDQEFAIDNMEKDFNPETDEEEGPRLRDFMPTEKCTYKSNSEMYEDNYSSAIILMFFGVAGLLLIILDLMEAISIFTTAFQYIFGIVIFMAFVIYSIVSFKKAKNYKKNITSEKKSKENLMAFLKDTVTKDFIKEINCEDMSQEEAFLVKIERIKEHVMDNYDQAEEEEEIFIDSVIEDYYNESFTA